MPACCFVCRSSGYDTTRNLDNDSDEEEEYDEEEKILDNITIDGFILSESNASYSEDATDHGVCRYCFKNLNCDLSLEYSQTLELVVAVHIGKKYPHLFIKGTAFDVDREISALLDPFSFINMFDNGHLNKIIVQYFQPFPEGTNMRILVQNPENKVINHWINSEETFWREHLLLKANNQEQATIDAKSIIKQRSSRNLGQNILLYHLTIKIEFCNLRSNMMENLLQNKVILGKRS